MYLTNIQRKRRRWFVAQQGNIVMTLWGKPVSALNDDEWNRYRRLVRMTSYYRKHTKNKAQQRKDKMWIKLDILRKLGLRAACARCGYQRYIGALDFHHRDPHEKRGQKVTTVDEARKCDLLCANCHRELHAEIRASGVCLKPGGRPMGEVDPWLADYMRLSGCDEATIAAAHAGRPTK